MHWVLVLYLMGRAQGYTCLEEGTPLPNPWHYLRKATVALKMVNYPTYLCSLSKDNHHGSLYLDLGLY